MLSRVFCAVVVVWVASIFAVAQDPTKVEPKHYKLDFENDHVQVVNVHYGPHEKSQMHDHPGGVSVSVSGGHLRFTDQNGKVTEVYAKAGEARWFPPFKHKVENLGDEPYNGVYIGIKSTVAASASDPKPGSPLGAEQLAKLLADQALADYAPTMAKP
jgi:quercetin dioxygenase-like cupin family protein